MAFKHIINEVIIKHLIRKTEKFNFHFSLFASWTFDVGDIFLGHERFNDRYRIHNFLCINKNLKKMFFLYKIQIFYFTFFLSYFANLLNVTLKSFNSDVLFLMK